MIFVILSVTAWLSFALVLIFGFRGIRYELKNLAEETARLNAARTRKGQ